MTGFENLHNCSATHVGGKFCFPDTERSGGSSGKTWKRFARSDPTRRVVPRERRADHELDLVEQHQRDDDKPDVPGEQQGCDRDAVDEAFL